MNQQSVIFAARTRVSRPALVKLALGNLTLFAVAVLSLRIPDSHVWQLVLSLLVAVALLAIFLYWNVEVLQRIRMGGRNVPTWVAALVLAGWLALAALLLHGIAFAVPNIEMRAGFWNSQMSPALRHALPYTRLVWLQSTVIDLARWLLVPALLLPFVLETVAFGLRGPAFTRALRVCLRWQHWVLAVMVLGLDFAAVRFLVDWHPAHSPSGETISAVMRLGTAMLLIVVGVLALLAVDAELLHRKAVEKTAAS